MAWLDSYRQASFRGVDFYVESHESKFGRRQVTHQYPQRDKPFTEDLGRRAREFTVDAYLVGDDYPGQRDRLMAECEKAGPGDLVHPYHGNMSVVCTGLRVRETSRDLRMCRLQMTFVESGLAQYPNNDADSVRAISQSSAAMKDASRDGFLERFTVSGFASFVIDSAVSDLAEFSGLFNQLPVNPTGSEQDVAELFDQASRIASDALALVENPGALADEVLGAIGRVRNVYGLGAETVLRMMRASYGTSPVAAGDTRNRRQQAQNRDAFDALVRRVSLSEQATAAVIRAEESAQVADAVRAGEVSDTTGLPGFQTRDDAIAARDEIADAIDVEAEIATTSVDEFQRLTDLRSKVVQGLPSAELRLPRVAQVIPPSTLPSLVVSYAFYGTAARATEIAARNKARHPGFMTGQQPIQVITDA